MVAGSDICDQERERGREEKRSVVSKEVIRGRRGWRNDQLAIVVLMVMDRTIYSNTMRAYMICQLLQLPVYNLVAN